MDIRKVKKLIELMEASDVQEIEIKEGEEAIRISRAARAALPEVSAVRPVQTETQMETVVPVASVSPAPQPSKSSGHVMGAPMVGTFYRAPSPNSPAFVEVGHRIEEGDILCIIESMKMMNQVKAERAGTIEAILVENDSPVEYDQPLFTIS